MQAKKQRQYDRADALWRQLMGRYEVFRQYKTLEVGFKPTLIEAIHNSQLFAEKSVYIIELFLKRYTSSSIYLKNALKYKYRYNLSGEQVGRLSKKDLAYYSKELEKHNKPKPSSSAGTKSKLPLLSLKR